MKRSSSAKRVVVSHQSPRKGLASKGKKIEIQQTQRREKERKEETRSARKRRGMRVTGLIPNTAGKENSGRFNLPHRMQGAKTRKIRGKKAEHGQLQWQGLISGVGGERICQMRGVKGPPLLRGKSAISSSHKKPLNARLEKARNGRERTRRGFPKKSANLGDAKRPPGDENDVS